MKSLQQTKEKQIMQVIRISDVEGNGPFTTGLYGPLISKFVEISITRLISPFDNYQLDTLVREGKHKFAFTSDGFRLIFQHLCWKYDKSYFNMMDEFNEELKDYGLFYLIGDIESPEYVDGLQVCIHSSECNTLEMRTTFEGC